MTHGPKPRIGYTCAYTPVQLLDAAGFVPHRILPMGDAPDEAGTLLHDNLCPHVKRVLDRALDGRDLPELAGVVFMASCDAMRRLADAWPAARPKDRVLLVDLPSARNEPAVTFLAAELQKLRGALTAWGGVAADDEALLQSIDRYNGLAHRLAALEARAGSGTLPGGRAVYQGLLTDSVAQPVEDTLAALDLLEAKAPSPAQSGLPVFLFGNVLPDPAALELIESCGARVVADDLCTGSKQLVPMELSGTGALLHRLARATLERPPCARTLDCAKPMGFAADVVDAVRASGARGVIAHVLKFCDPYLSRLPKVREELREAGIPMLALEGDCTLRSLGQHRTRIEAFVEMLHEVEQ
ncbi:MAG: 2-hydroxyacyl-CoA dehydratase family protein [bacterium]